MVAVADFRARAGCGPTTMSRSGLRATSSAAKAAQAILGLGITIFDDQVLSIDPAMVSQAVKQCDVHGRTLERTPSRRRVPCAHERRGETSSAAVAAMNSRRFIRSSSQLEDDGTYRITSRWSSHSVRANAKRGAGLAVGPPVEARGSPSGRPRETSAGWLERADQPSAPGRLSLLITGPGTPRAIAAPSAGGLPFTQLFRKRT